jgi:hypothetical protein
MLDLKILHQNGCLQYSPTLKWISSPYLCQKYIVSSNAWAAVSIVVVADRLGQVLKQELLKSVQYTNMILQIMQN